MSHANFGQRRSLIMSAKLFEDTITNGKSQTLLSDFFAEDKDLYCICIEAGTRCHISAFVWLI